MLQPSIAEAITWLPLMLLGAHLSLTRSRWRVRGMLLAGAMMGLSFLGGHTQTTLEMTYLTAGYVAVIGWQNGISWKGIIGRIALFGLCGAAISAVQLLPTTEFTLLAYRSESYHFADKANGFTLPELIQFVWPRLFKAEWWPLYTGVIGGLLALSALLRPRREVVFWIGVIVVGVWLSLGGRSSVYDAFYLLAPGFSVFRDQERIASVLVFALVVLATYQLDRLLSFPASPPSPLSIENGEGEWRRLAWLARGHLALTGIVFAVLTLVLLIREKAPNDPTANAAGHVVLISLMFNVWLIGRQRVLSAAEKVRPRQILSGALLALLVLDLFSVGMDSPNFVPDNEYNRIQPPANLDLLSPPLDDIQWHVDGAAGLQGNGVYWQVPDIYGTIPFSLATTEKLRQIRVDRRWEVFAVRYAMMTAEVPDNVPVQVVGDGVNYDGEDYTLYELTNPRPFAHLVYQVRVSEDGLDGEREIMKEPILDLREIGVTEHALPFELPGQRPADARVDAFKMVMPEYMEMSVTTSANALLTVAVANYPGWQAEVNGHKVDILDTYAGLIGIPIPAGTNQKVTLHFMPRSVMLGGVISALALIAVVGYVLGEVVLARRRKQPR